MVKEVVIVSAVRTAIGSFGGALSTIPAHELGSTVVKAALDRINLDYNLVDEVIMGNVLQAGQGGNPARQAAINAGLSVDIPAMTINKLCGSGLKAVHIAYQAIASGEADVIVAGGMENMSLAPYLLQGARFGFKMGDQTIEDSMLKDGLIDPFYNYHMGITAENIAEKYEKTREEQDQFAQWSQEKTKKAIQSGAFDEEIVPVVIKPKRGEPIIFKTDEFPKPESTYERLSALRPAFKKDGTVTAGNASGLNDGAAVLILMSKERAVELGISAMAEIKANGNAGVDPQYMGLGPIPATRKALARANWRMEDIDLVEVNEAFAAQVLAVTDELQISKDKLNVNGGAISLGHPIGASGARILITLLYEMKRRHAKKGLSALCIGGGMGVATLIERNEEDL